MYVVPVCIVIINSAIALTITGLLSFIFSFIFPTSFPVSVISKLAFLLSLLINS